MVAIEIYFRNTKVYEKLIQLMKHFKKACKHLAKKLPGR